MKYVYRLLNPIKNYPWGSHTAIAELLGRQAPTLQPQAELWLGAHPRGKSIAVTEMGEIPLDRLLRQQSSALLGRRPARLFDKRLPFLLKILAADQPLSLQAHPDRRSARNGHRQEQQRGVARDAPERRYPDPWPKPELVYALTPFTVLHGFRRWQDVVDDLDRLALTSLEPLVERLPQPSTAELFLALLGLEPNEAQALARIAAERATELVEDPTVGERARWTTKLAELHPRDAGILAPFLLNLLRLEPGQALFTEAGILHAYLEGTAIEVMGASDNVLRGGLTSKFVDVVELSRVMVRDESAPVLVGAEIDDDGSQRFETPAREFELRRIVLGQERSYEAPPERNLQLLLLLGGSATFDNGERQLELKAGQSLVVGAAAAPYRVSGEGQLFLATVPELGAGDEEWPEEETEAEEANEEEEDKEDAASDGSESESSDSDRPPGVPDEEAALGRGSAGAVEREPGRG